MADIELVIKIPEEDFERCKNRFQRRIEIMGDAIANGTPLPKGHGRIMDVDKIIKKMEEREECLKDNRSMYETACVETALDMFGDTIIEADKEYEVEVITRGNCMMCGKELTEGLFFCKECEAKAIQGRK